jgi:hypothetical protein
LLGAELGRSENEVRSIELAARLHCLELAGAAELRQVGSLRDVERIMRGARQGGSRRLRIPLDAQVVAVASAFDMLTSSPEASRLSADAALNELRGDGKRYREEVLDALWTVVRRGSRRPDRRRSAPRPAAPPRIPRQPALDPPTEVSGAA